MQVTFLSVRMMVMGSTGNGLTCFFQKTGNTLSFHSMSPRML